MTKVTDFRAVSRYEERWAASSDDVTRARTPWPRLLDAAARPEAFAMPFRLLPFRPFGRLLAAFAIVAALVALVSLPTAGHANSLFPGPAGVRATISLAKQQMNVVINRGNGVKETYSWKVSTGRKGFETPPGQFRPDYLDEMHYSSKYEDAPMPFSVFFNDGIAVHATTETKHLGRPASHGCVRLDKANAETFFRAVAEIGMMRTAIYVEK